MAPYEPMKHLYFLVEGSVRIYGVRRDGGIFHVSAASQLTMLGDLEFCGNGVSPFFVEARTPSACVALNLDRWKEELNRDLRFLHVLLESFMEKNETLRGDGRRYGYGTGSDTVLSAASLPAGDNSASWQGTLPAAPNKNICSK